MAKNRAFTLTELLVVVAVISLLLAIFAPSLRRVKYLTRLSVCSSNLHGVAVGVNNYASVSRGFYPSRVGVPLSGKSNFLTGPGQADDRERFQGLKIIRNLPSVFGYDLCQNPANFSLSPRDLQNKRLSIAAVNLPTPYHYFSGNRGIE